MSTSYKNIVFDLGGVIVDLDIPSSFAAFAQIGLVPQHVNLEEMTNNGIPPDWPMLQLMHAMDIGDMDGQQFTATLKPQCLPGTTDEQILQAFNRIIRMPRHRLEWLQRLRKNYRVYLLSNIGDVHWKETCRQASALGIPIEECFDEVFLSYRMRMAKPDAAIYQRLITETGINPRETLYIDDLPDNIEAGRKTGLQVLKTPTNRLDEILPSIFSDIQ